MSALSAAQAAAFAATWAQTEIDLADAFGIGGGSWTRTRRTGATPSADATTTTATIAGRVVRERIDRMARLRSGGLVGDAAWWFIGAAGVDVQTHDELTSVADGSRYVVLANVSADQGYVMAEVAPL